MQDKYIYINSKTGEQVDKKQLVYLFHMKIEVMIYDSDFNLIGVTDIDDD